MWIVKKKNMFWGVMGGWTTDYSMATIFCNREEAVEVAAKHDATVVSDTEKE